MNTSIFTACFFILFTFVSIAGGAGVVLRDGETTVQGEIVGLDDDRVTLRTSSGFSTYTFDELSPDWLEANRERLQSTPARKVLTRRPTSSATIRMTWPDHPLFVLPVVTVLVLTGLSFCFFGWKIFRFRMMVRGVLFGVILGLFLGYISTEAIINVLVDKPTPEVKMGIFVVLGSAMSILFATLGRRFAMLNARLRPLSRLGTGGMQSAFALFDFTFFNVNMIIFYALIGAIMITVGLMYAASIIPVIEEEYPKHSAYGSTAIGLFFALLGCSRQIKRARASSGRR